MSSGNNFFLFVKKILFHKNTSVAPADSFDSLFSCRFQCPMAFKSRSTFVGHCKNAHKYDDNGEPDTPLPPHKVSFSFIIFDKIFVDRTGP